jgi:plastocyanin
MDGTDPTVNDATAKPRWTRLAALGLFMVGLAAFLMVAASLIWGLDVAEDLPFFLSLVIVPWVVAFLVWRFGTWAKVVGIVIALASIGAMFWTAFGLAEPTSFFDFVPGLLVVPGALIAIAASIGAIVAGRRGHTSWDHEGNERRTINAVVAVVGALAAVSAVLTVVGRSTVETPDGASTVTLANFEFDRSAYEKAAGAQVVVKNDDPFLHTFTIDDLDIDVEVGPNGSALVDIPAEAGTYVVYCRPHTVDPADPGPDDMASTLTVG